MDTLAFFFNRILIDHCTCFNENCRIGNIASARVAQLLENFAETTVKPPAFGTTNCKIIHSSGTPIVQQSMFPWLPFEKINFYLDCMVDLGLILRPNFMSNDDVRPWPAVLESVDNLLDAVEQDDRKFFHLFYNGEYIDWKYIHTKWTAQRLPVSYVSALAPLRFTPQELLDLGKVLFWFLRKSIVDNLIISMMPDDVGCLALSAGSITLTSDYDVNLYGEGAEWISLFFQDQFIKIFGMSSDAVFDTNLYSSSFMSLLEPETFSDRYEFASCGPYRFWYVRVDPETEEGLITAYDQHLWAALKVVNAITYLAEMNSPDALKLTRDFEDNDTWNALLTLCMRLDMMTQKADELVFELKQKRPNYRDYLNHLSLINYKGSETYYTRGAFLDVVVNQQMCASRQGTSHVTPLTLDEHVYFDSMIENLADYCKHDGKVKYRNRVAVARGHLFQLARNMEPAFASLDRFLTGESATATIYNLLALAWAMCETMLYAAQTRESESSMQRLMRYLQSLTKRVATSRADLL